VVERLQGVAGRRGVSMPDLALAWMLANPAMQVAIVGTPIATGRWMRGPFAAAEGVRCER
jgi:predicted oxidoreductase